jgi:hypothetical protein
MAVDAATAEFVWRVPLGVNDRMPEGKKNRRTERHGIRPTRPRQACQRHRLL